MERAQQSAKTVSNNANRSSRVIILRFESKQIRKDFLGKVTPPCAM